MLVANHNKQGNLLRSIPIVLAACAAENDTIRVFFFDSHGDHTPKGNTCFPFPAYISVLFHIFARSMLLFSPCNACNGACWGLLSAKQTISMMVKWRDCVGWWAQERNPTTVELTPQTVSNFRWLFVLSTRTPQKGSKLATQSLVSRFSHPAQVYSLTSFCCLPDLSWPDWICQLFYLLRSTFNLKSFVFFSFKRALMESYVFGH